MTIEQFVLLAGVIVAPIPPIVLAAAWIYGNLGKLTTQIALLGQQVSSYGDRIQRLEDAVAELKTSRNRNHAAPRRRKAK